MISTLIILLVAIIVGGIVVGLLFRAIDYLPIIAAEWKNACKALVCIIAALILLALFLPMAGVNLGHL